MIGRTLLFSILGALAAVPSSAQESDFGFSLPVTLSGAGIYSERLQQEEPDKSRLNGGFRAMLYPTLKLGSHWFAYSAVQVRLEPYFYYDAYDGDHDIYANVIQAFLGYTFRTGQATTVVKAGRLSSAFGAFPLRYDDVENPLLDQPLQYVTRARVNTNQLPCGVHDLTSQDYGTLWFYCGGAPDWQPGLTPVTLYGLTGVEADISGYRFDGRIQVTDGSPASPQRLNQIHRYAQWTAGGGYTIRQGFRVGASGFRGPYLDQAVAPFLPAGTTVRDYPASGLGADVQFGQGHWSLTGEWQKFWFDSPNFTKSPTLTAAYAEVKRVLSPRLYLAGRVGWLKSGGAVDSKGTSTSEFAPGMGSYEFAAGCWLNRRQLLKVGYEWLAIDHQSGARNNVLGIQLVTSFRPVDWAFR